MIISIAGQKGGAGKTMVAISLAMEWFDRGCSVLLVDTDPQGSTQRWGDIADAQGEEIPPVVSMRSDIFELLPPLAAGYDIVIVDTPPRLDEVQRAAIITSDLVIYPCAPAPTEVWALARSLDVLEEGRKLKPDLPAVIVINRQFPRTTLGRHIRKPLEKQGLPVLKTEIHNRIAYPEALTQGTGPNRWAAGKAAAREVAAMVNELEKMFMQKETARVA